MHVLNTRINALIIHC